MAYKEIFEKAYKGKKVLLTGHTGFKGSWMLAWLNRLGAIVKGYALQPEHDNDLYNLMQGDTLCDSVIGDLRDAALVSETIHSFQPDFIFHLAAQPLVRRSYRQPLYTFEVNAIGTAHVMEALRTLQKPCTVVIITTDKVYENMETGEHYKETDKLGGHDPYSASKAAAEIIVHSYKKSFFDPARVEEHKKSIATARAGNVIGGGDRSEDRIFPDMIRAFEKNEPVIVRNPASVRPWQHVLEPISGYLLLGAKMVEQPQQYEGAWNFGPLNHDVLTVKQVVEQAIDVWGKAAYTTPSLKDQPHEAGLLMLDIDKAVKKLSWTPKMNSSEAIRETMNWYRHAPQSGIARFTLEQVRQYEELA